MVDHKETARTMLKIITGKERVIFTSRCNESIRFALQLASRESKTNILYQEEGGWLTYEKYIKQANLNPVKLITDFGLVYPADLDVHDTDSALMVNSLAGYIAPQNMDALFSHCLKNDVFLINDVSGSIGTSEAKQGEVIIGSFGNGKPVDLGTGGFIAVQTDDLFETLTSILGDDYSEPELNYKLLSEKLKNLESRRTFLENKARQVKEDLKEFNIVHRDAVGLNVVVLFDTPEQKKSITDYCDENDLEFTVCPREIRVLEPAISIEIKRLTNTLKNQ